MPCCAPSALQQRDIAAAALAEGEIVAGDDARRADPLRRAVGDELLGAGRGAARWSNSNTSIASAPAWANSASRWSSVVRRNGGRSGLKKRTGWGSKVATITGRRSWKPRWIARPTTAWWPRWKPSKLPSATMLPARLSGMPPARVRRCIGSRRLVGREVFAKQAVFVDRERDHEQVEDAEQDQRRCRGCSCSGRAGRR